MRSIILSSTLILMVVGALGWVIFRTRNPPAEMPPERRSKCANATFSSLLCLMGVLFFLSGKTGHKFAYAEGPHVKIGGALLAIVGGWGLFHAVRAKKKEPNQSPEPTLTIRPFSLMQLRLNLRPRSG
jgi:hypothetical protein